GDESALSRGDSLTDEFARRLESSEWRHEELHQPPPAPAADLGHDASAPEDGLPSSGPDEPPLAPGPDPSPAPAPDPGPPVPRLDPSPPAPAPEPEPNPPSDRAAAVLTAVLDDLGSAHHRPFSR
ncbi:MAG TPA: hypothetical protein VGY97_03195, partial [Solirubrobacteraceae bacterium]|nr:hypothetical protein [Solirubrobacteraceae bacterium]